MKLLRIIDEDSRLTYAAEVDAGYLRVDGDILASYRVTDRPVRPREVLPPVAPPVISAVFPSSPKSVSISMFCLPATALALL